MLSDSTISIHIDRHGHVAHFSEHLGSLPRIISLSPPLVNHQYTRALPSFFRFCEVANKLFAPIGPVVNFTNKYLIIFHG